MKVHAIWCFSLAIALAFSGCATYDYSREGYYQGRPTVEYRYPIEHSGYPYGSGGIGLFDYPVAPYYPAGYQPMPWPYPRAYMPVPVQSGRPVTGPRPAAPRPAGPVSKHPGSPWRNLNEFHRP